MTLAYCMYFHRRNIPQVQCLIASIRRFDRESLVVCVIEDECLTDCKFILEDENIMALRMSYAERECDRYGLDWGSVRDSRSARDTAWTFQACYPYWWLQELEADGIVYVDSDVYFFQDLRPYIDSLPETAHVALCPHHYPPGKENLSAGHWNNGLMWWRNSDKARWISWEWGKEAIEKWEPHEQKLLDTWPDRYAEAVAEFPRGVDVGPWQLSEYHLTACSDGFIRTTSPDGTILQSYHAHEFRLDAIGNNPVTIKGRQANLTNYAIHPATRESVYEPYLRELEKYL